MYHSFGSEGFQYNLIGTFIRVLRTFILAYVLVTVFQCRHI